MALIGGVLAALARGRGASHVAVSGFPSISPEEAFAPDGLLAQVAGLAIVMGIEQGFFPEDGEAPLDMVDAPEALTGTRVVMREPDGCSVTLIIGLAARVVLEGPVREGVLVLDFGGVS